MRLCKREDFSKRNQTHIFDAYAKHQLESGLICPDLAGVEMENFIDSVRSKSFMLGVAACN